MTHLDPTEEARQYSGYITLITFPLRDAVHAPSEGYDSFVIEEIPNSNIVKKVSYNLADKLAAGRANEPKCGNCRFYRNYECHRFPPSIRPANSPGCGEWPTPAVTDWCGEFVRADR